VTKSSPLTGKKCANDVNTDFTEKEKQMAPGI
jgi:hypothetical protein